MSTESKEDKKKNKKAIILILLLLLLLIGAFYVIFNYERLFGHHEAGDGIGLYIDPNSSDYVAPEVEEKPSVAIPGWGTFTIPPETTKLTNMVDFFNPETNKDYYYLTFELRLLKNNGKDYEVLYKSGLLEPGKHIQTIDIAHGLKAGTYDAVIHVQPYTMDNQTPLNNADMNTKIIVK